MGGRGHNKHFQDLRKRVTVEDGDEAIAGVFPTSETGIFPNIIQFSVVLVFSCCRNKLAQNLTAQASTYYHRVCVRSPAGPTGLPAQVSAGGAVIRGPGERELPLTQVLAGPRLCGLRPVSLLPVTQQRYTDASPCFRFLWLPRHQLRKGAAFPGARDETRPTWTNNSPGRACSANVRAPGTRPRRRWGAC